MDLSLGAEGWDGQAQAWVETMSQAYWWVFLAWAAGAGALFLLMTFVFVPAVRRRFWCAEARRAVDVVFEEYGVPGWRRPFAVVTCSAFDPPADVRCSRDCLCSAARIPLADAPPVEETTSRGK